MAHPAASLRREFLRCGAVGLLGLSLPRLLASETRQLSPRKPAANCILFFLEGGPAHQDLWDMKPEAPAEIRGEFHPIPSSLPGVPVCEHLPLLSRQLHHFALVRSVHHQVVDHNAGAYFALTGRAPFHGGRLIVRDEPENFPPLGSVLAKLRPSSPRLPSFVHLPEIMSNNGYDIPGQRAGFLGTAWDPFVIGDPSAPGYQVPELSLPVDMPPDRFRARRELLRSLERRFKAGREGSLPDGMAPHVDKAFDLITSEAAQRAFDLSAESPQTRQLYGLPDRADRSVEARQFGGLPHLGQCMLMARRLIEAGVRLVTVCTGRRFDQSWDTHRQHFPLLKRSLLPYADRALAALIADLHDRGLLQETLVVAMGEFGRTPRLGQVTSSAGAEANGRDHWPHCYTVLLAGGGIQPGAVYGASDRYAAYPERDPVTPEDIAATIYTALGLNPQDRLLDPTGRPHHLAEGHPIRAILS